MMPMILSSMNKKRWILLIILIFTILGISLFIINNSKRYNHYVVSKTKWENIIKSRKEDNSLIISNLSINDFNLVLDKNTDTLYYTMMDSSIKNNPRIEYIANSKENKIVISNKLNSTDTIEIMIYNKTSYHIYTLKVTTNPIIDITYHEVSNKKWYPIELTIYDNHKDAFQKIIKSAGELMIFDKEYHILLRKESLGRNERKNELPILGMNKNSEFILNNSKGERQVELFINNEYLGTYSIDHRVERRMIENDEE